MNQSNSEYQLIDSGEGMKLERFGNKMLARPSSVCLWRKRRAHDWNEADAVYIPGRNEDSGGWKFKQKNFETWDLKYAGCTLSLRLQKNGQIGLFPEHGTYLEELAPYIELSHSQETKTQPRLLNLFAYTGLCSAFFALRGWMVTHVDLSKKALSWAKDNFEKNDIKENAIRFICDDAIKFLEREVKRKVKYDAVVVDPPSFSRTSKESFWKLEDVIAEILGCCNSLLGHDRAILVATCHHPGIGAEMIANVLRDLMQQGQHVVARELSIPERASPRRLPAGSLAMLLPN